MTKYELKAWAAAALKTPHRVIYSDDNGYKMQFDNGDTYESRVTLWTTSHKITQFYINGIHVYTSVFD